MKFYIETFGCQMNIGDSLEMARHLKARGFSQTQNKDGADWVLVNSCTVRDHAEHKALSYLGRLEEWKAVRPGRRIVFTGCAAENLKDKIQSRFPTIDLVVGAKSIGSFRSALDQYLQDRVDYPAFETDGSDAVALPQASRAIAYVTIMRGCNYSCSYCIVPDVRGREIYRAPEEILADVRARAAAGAKEVMLLGQTVNSYKPAPNSLGITDFSELLNAVAEVPGVRRIRFISPHPFYLSEKLIRTLAENPRVCPHMHLPVQSGSDAVLKRMRRNYTRAEFLDRVARLKAAVPGIAVTTDFIVGFPGETDADFEQTLSLLKEAEFAGGYCFKYSPRPGTVSAAGPDDVPQEAKEERLERLLELENRFADAAARAAVGKTADIMVESIEVTERGALYHGRTPTFLNVSFTAADKFFVGDFVDVEITKASHRVLRGKARALQTAAIS